MEPYDLEQIVGKEMKLIGLSGETFQQGRAGNTPDPGPAAREIEQAVDQVCQRHSHSEYDLLMAPEYMFDPDYKPDQIDLVLGWPMPGLLFGPYPDW